jgi:ferredoxin
MSDAAFRITIEGDDASFGCPAGERVLIAMEQQGLKHVPVGCRGGGCGVCRVRVTKGRYHTAKMSRAHVSARDEAAGFALACRLIPETDLSLLPAAATHDARTRPWQ